MHLYLYILLYFLILPNFIAKKIEIQCPLHCKCDIYENLRRASCNNHNLAAIEQNLPPQTQILDLAFNQISNLNDNTFLDQKLVSLKLLNISHNKVSQIHMNAFRGLNDLKTLDLSYNALQYILKHWFWSLKSLEELYLSFNSFAQFSSDESLFESTTLKILDLSNCKIAHIGNNALADLPNLEKLDLTGNFLIHLNVKLVKPLENLAILDVARNTFSCDDVMQELSNFCTRKGIRFKDPCRKNVTTSEKFQRIVNMAEPEDEKNSWIYEDEEIVKNITIEHCNETQVDKGLLQEIVDLSPVLSILIPFIYGIAVGILIACLWQTCYYKKKENGQGNSYVSFNHVDRTINQQRLRRNNSRSDRTINRQSILRQNSRSEDRTASRHSIFRRNNSRSEDRQSLHMKEWELSESTPVLFRKNLNL